MNKQGLANRAIPISIETGFPRYGVRGTKMCLTVEWW